MFKVSMCFLYFRHPPNWAKHLQGVIQRDKILPDALKSVLDSDNNIFDVTMKILHYGPDFNSIIRPGQILDVKTMNANDGKLSKVYLCTKALIKLLRINVKSYLVKKIILTNDTKMALLKDSSMSECLFHIVKHPEFMKRLDLKKRRGEMLHLERWEQNIAEQKDPDKIPMIQAQQRQRREREARSGRGRIPDKSHHRL